MILLEISAALLFICEAILETYVIRMKNPNILNYNELNKKEHFWSGVYSVVLILVLCVCTRNYFLIPSLALSRRLFFDYGLKLLRSRPFKRIEGDGWFDNTSRSIFGPNRGYLELLTVLILKVCSYYFALRMTGMIQGI